VSVKLQISLEDIAKQLQDKDSKYTTLQEVLDEVYGIGITATNIASLLTGGGITVPDLFKDFKPSKFLNNFMPNKYINVSKEENAINRYEKLAISNLSIILVSFNQSVKDNQKLLEKYIKNFQKLYNVDDYTDEMLVQFAIENAKKIDLQMYKLTCPIPQGRNPLLHINFIKFYVSIFKILPTYEETEELKQELMEKIMKDTLKYYNINLLEIMSEFPEVKMWIDLNFQQQMIEENGTIKDKIKQIEEYQLNQFTKQFGLEDINKILQENSNTQLQNIQDILDQPTLNNINKHHNSIKEIIEEPLIKENDIQNLILPKRNEIYIPQSYKYFYYQKAFHKKDYLDDEKWSNIEHNDGEDIGKELFKALRDPYNINNPIIILGHPGAGKSMLSSQFAYKLIGNNEFIPFYIKLREVDSSTSDVDTHINQGISKTIAGNREINWADMAEKFPDKIAVIILDGFDELLRATQTQLNDYIINIQKLQKKAQTSGLNIRVVLTSRLTIMQDVSIPEDSLIIKLNSFDKQRKDLWINKWNETQIGGTKFTLPNREDINELSQEPLLLFLLALYDFEDNSLSKIASEQLSRSSLYDKLFEGFTIRQLRKNPKYNSSNDENKKEMEELFRLRIGFFATMLFLRDKVHHLEKDFDEELNVFKLSTYEIKAKTILDGFFFIHKDKSTDGQEIENLSFEFLHKTFGEFLAADFMLRIAKLRAKDDINISHLSEEKYFRQIFSFQWIYKQPKILEFFFEHAINIIGNTSTDLIKWITKELKNLLDENAPTTLPAALHQLKTFEKLKHSAIYSQNLLLLWIAIENKEFEFRLSRDINHTKSWKVLVDLWKNYGGYEYVSFLSQYIKIKNKNKKIILTKVQNNISRFTDYSNYTQIAKSAYETILSFYDVDNLLLEDILRIDNGKDKYFKAEVSNLIIDKIDKLYKDNENFFNERTYWNLWKNCSFEKKIKLSNFYLEMNIEYTKINVIKYLYNSIQFRDNTGIGHVLNGIPEDENFSPYETLSLWQKIMAVEHILNIDEGSEYVYRSLKMIYVDKTSIRELLINQQILLFEVSSKNKFRRVSIFHEIFIIFLKKNIERKELSIEQLIKLLEIAFESDSGRRGYTKSIFSALIKKDNEGIKLSVEQRIRLLEIAFEFDSIGKRYPKDIILELLNITYEGVELSTEHQIKLLEFSFATGDIKDRYNEDKFYSLLKNTFTRRLSTNQLIRLLAISFELDRNKIGLTEDIFRKLLSRTNEGKKLSINQQIILLEISFEIDGGTGKYTKKLISYLKSTQMRHSKRVLSDYISYIEHKLNQPQSK